MNAHELGLEVGKTYAARKGSRSPERTIIWINEAGTQVQYDGPAVRNGRHYPSASTEDFAKWAGIVPR
ncbi:MAG: hypothetical protein IH568_01090 [Burkholderiaceae bacterium]|jgi:hypothetical protein|nr:hypothetical protein [Burkholderiaceae bacterium]